MNQGHTHREQMGAEAEGRALLAHLVATRGRAGEPAWRERIEAGQVLIDGAPAAADQPLRKGQWLTWARPPWEEPAVPLCAAILHRDEDLLAVAKPSGLPTLPAGGEFLEHTLLSLVRRIDPAASPMHRLGRATSGIVLFARSAAAARSVQEQLRTRSVRKSYRALCTGEPARDAFAIDLPIGPVPHALLGTVHAASASGKPSHSLVRVLERRGSSSLLEVAIETGRPHQIRIHLASAGHPVVGGVPRAGATALPGDPGYLLHAHRLTLAHPRTGAELMIECPPPPLLRDL